MLATLLTLGCLLRFSHLPPGVTIDNGTIRVHVEWSVIHRSDFLVGTIHLRVCTKPKHEERMRQTTDTYPNIQPKNPQKQTTKPTNRPAPECHKMTDYDVPTPQHGVSRRVRDEATGQTFKGWTPCTCPSPNIQMFFHHELKFSSLMVSFIEHAAVPTSRHTSLGVHGATRVPPLWTGHCNDGRICSNPPCAPSHVLHPEL